MEKITEKDKVDESQAQLDKKIDALIRISIDNLKQEIVEKISEELLKINVTQIQIENLVNKSLDTVIENLKAEIRSSLSREKNVIENQKNEINNLIAVYLDNTRENLKTEIRSELSEQTRPLKEKAFIRNFSIAIYTTVFTLFTIFVAPDVVKKWTKDFVEEKLTAGSLKESADEIMNATMKDYIDKKFEPLINKVDSANKQVEETKVLSQNVSSDYALLKGNFDTLKENVIKVEEELKNNQEKLKNLIIESERTINQTNDFFITVIKADNDHWPSFEKLVKFRDDPKFLFKTEAESAVLKIRSKFAEFSVPYMEIQWNQKIDPSNIDVVQVVDLMKNLKPWNHAALVKIIANTTKLTRKDKLGFIYKILTTSDSLTGRFYAGRYFVEISKVDFKWNPFIIEPIIDWWNKNKLIIGNE